MHVLTLLFQAFLVLSSFLSFSKAQSPPYDPSPFNIIGTIDAMTLDAGSDPLRGGTITVNGLKITVPKNLLATLPSIAVAWPELFKNGQPDLPQLGTVSWEANVIGNRVKDEHIAGLIYIAQQSTQILQGFISAIDTATGHFHVSGNFADGSTGIECVLNDPLGRFGKNYTDNPLWTVDPDNPSVRTQHGVPMCIPRSANDPLCPKSQRPNGETKITFGAPPVAAGSPDPTKMIPLIVGDYVTFSGTEVGNGLLAVYSLQANVASITAPGTKPAYVTVEEAIYAVVSGDPNLEDGETRATAFSSDPSVNLQWFAMDVDPCTGVVTERNLLLVKPQNAAPVGKAVFRSGGQGTKTDFSPVTRQVGFRLSSGTTDGPGGIIAGQFIQPIFSYTFPELIVFGNNIPPNQLDLFPYLVKGGGPYIPGNFLAPTKPSNTTIVGQLNPWPGAAGSVPAPTACPPPGPPTSSSAAPPTSSTPAGGTPPVDTVTIVAATAKNGQGSTHVSVSANTNDKTATLFFQATGVNPIGKSPMTSNGNGQWSFSIDVKGKPTTALVTSDHGGSATRNF